MPGVRIRPPRPDQYRVLASLALAGTLLLLLLPGEAIDALKVLFGLDPSGDHGPSLLGWDKLVHFGLFGATGFLMARGWQSPGWQLLAGLTLLGAVTELLQFWVVPGRHGMWADVVANGLGAAAGIGLVRLHPGLRCGSAAR